MITASMITPIVAELTDVVAVVLPVGVSIMGIMLGIKMIPRIFHMFF